MMHGALPLLAVGVGGAVGAILRWLVSTRWLGIPAAPAWPWATFVVNVSGSFLFGLLAVALAASGGLNDNARLLLMTGLLGAFTTWSTFAFEVVRLIELRAWALAIGYGSGTLAACIGAAALGLWLGRRLFE